VVPERDRRTQRSNAGNTRFEFDLRRQHCDLGRQEPEEARLREARRADQRRRELEEEEEEETRLWERRRPDRLRRRLKGEDEELERACQRRAADGQAELDHERRLNDLLRDRVEL